MVNAWVGAKIPEQYRHRHMVGNYCVYEAIFQKYLCPRNN
jgi:hypothetical protein